MALRTLDQVVGRIAAGYWKQEPVYGEKMPGNVMPLTSTGWNQSNNGLTIVAYTRVTESLPSDVSAYIPAEFTSTLAPNRPYLLAELINLGSLACSTNVFTDGSAMPTETELGVSRVKSSPILVEVTTTLSGTPGNLTVTYVDQDGNAAEAGSAQALTASADGCSFYQLNSGDIGARDITTASVSLTGAGVLKFWGLIPIVATVVATGSAWGSENMVTNVINPRRIFDAKTIGVLQFGATNVAAGLLGSLLWVGDN